MRRLSLHTGDRAVRLRHGVEEGLGKRDVHTGEDDDGQTVDNGYCENCECYYCTFSTFINSVVIAFVLLCIV
jgi:hypothetical protein